MQLSGHLVSWGNWLGTQNDGQGKCASCRCELRARGTRPELARMSGPGAPTLSCTSPCSCEHRRWPGGDESHFPDLISGKETSVSSIWTPSGEHPTDPDSGRDLAGSVPERQAGPGDEEQL